MNNSKYLSIGSVVLLKGAKKRIMVVGFAATSEETKDKVFDYIGCLYPEGIIDSSKNLLFDHDQIDKIYALGYKDEEWVQTEERLKKIVEEMKNIKENQKNN